MIPAFERFVKNPFKGIILTFDPGQTTGWSKWKNSQLVNCGQLATFPVKESVLMMDKWLDTNLETFWTVRDDDKFLYPVKVVMEEYRVYSWKTDDHAQSTLHTSRFIGCLETLLTLKGVPYVMQGAGIAKGFCTDEKLKDWGFWQRGERHARDAIRHGAYFLCHGKSGE